MTAVRPGRGATLLASVAEVGFGSFGGIVGLLHLLRPDLDPCARTISEYALGPGGTAMTTAFLALGAGALALAAVAGGDPAAVRAWRPGRALFCAFGVGSALCAAFPTDPSAPGTVATGTGVAHNAAAVVAIGSGFAAMLVAGWRFRQLAGWRPLHRPTLALAILAVATSALVGRWAGFGAAERAFVTAIVLWHWAVARRARRLATAR